MIIEDDPSCETHCECWKTPATGCEGCRWDCRTRGGETRRTRSRVTDIYMPGTNGAVVICMKQKGIPRFLVSRSRAA